MYTCVYVYIYIYIYIYIHNLHQRLMELPAGLWGRVAALLPAPALAALEADNAMI